MPDHVNPFLEPPESFEIDLGPPRSADHFENGHDPSVLDLHGGDDIELGDAEPVIDIDLDGFDLDAVGLDDALDAVDRNGGRTR